MATAPKTTKKKPRGRPWKPGESGNKAGLPAAVRERRANIRNLLNEACKNPDGSDKLVNAIIDGVEDGDSTCLKLAAEYRFGKPTTYIATENDEPMSFIFNIGQG